MSFFSTRGKSCVTASQAILSGLAPDGGLYVPAMFPQFSQQMILSMVDMSWKERAVQILSAYLEDFSRGEISEMVDAAYSAERFDDPAICPVTEIDASTALLELYHGPTLAFKDIALQLLPHLITRSARKNGEQREVAILTATSGDTGKAALEGFRDVPGTSCTVFYPLEGVSRIQQLQMTTTAGSNTHVIAVRGNFDDAQTGVKELFSSAEFAAEMNQAGKVLSSANSINFGRLVPQIIYYFSTYADLIGQRRILPGDEINFVVPTGNFGDILAGYYARQMGLPIKKLICASNRNNVLADFFHTGSYSTHRMFVKTISPSMDILVSSNLERLLYETADRDGELVSLWMKQLKESGGYHIGEQRHDWLSSVFAASWADDRETKREIRDLWQQTHRLVDPHTAVGGCVLGEYRRNTGDNTFAVMVSTASPYKFAQDVLSAIEDDEAVQSSDAFECAARLEEITGVPVPPQIAALRDAPVRHKAVCDRDAQAMRAAVLEEVCG